MDTSNRAAEATWPALQPGETLCWEGRPAPRCYTFRHWRHALFGLLLCAFCTVWTWLGVQQAAEQGWPWLAWVPLPFLGYALWLAVYFAPPRPFRTYVLAHELTHALWGVLTGARIHRLSVSRHQGSVTLSKNNVLITLAPYFFPLYTMLVIAAYGVLSVFYDLEPYAPFWLMLVGLTWGFHFTFTLSTLLQHQTDITQYGRLFSYGIIYLMNVLGMALWVVLGDLL